MKNIFSAGLKFLTEKEVALIIGLSISTLQKHRQKQRGIPYSKFGRAVRYAYDDVVAYMEAHKISFTAN